MSFEFCMSLSGEDQKINRAVLHESHVVALLKQTKIGTCSPFGSQHNNVDDLFSSCKAATTEDMPLHKNRFLLKNWNYPGIGHHNSIWPEV